LRTRATAVIHLQLGVANRTILEEKVSVSTISVFPDITPEQQEYQELARKFTAEEIIPKAAHHDATGEVTASGLQYNSSLFISN